MSESLILCDFNKFKDEDLENPLFADFTLELAHAVHEFHSTIPGYQETPLISLDCLASKLNVNKILVKDESKRFDLNAYKFLGVAYAISIELLLLGLDKGNFLLRYM